MDWSAEDPFAAATAAVEDKAPAGEACELRTLQALGHLLDGRLDGLPGCLSGPAPRANSTLPAARSLAGSSSESSAMQCHAERASDAREYVRGQREILQQAREEVERRKQALSAGRGTAAVDEVKQKRPRVS